MAEGIGTCKKQLDKSKVLNSTLDYIENNKPTYKEPSEDSKFYGLESHFNENVVFYKDVTIHGKVNSNFLSQSTVFVGITSFLESVDFYENVYVDKDISAKNITARDRLNVGCGGTILTALPPEPYPPEDNIIVPKYPSRVGIGSTLPTTKFDVVGGDAYFEGNVGLGSTIPQQKLDVAGSIKIDATIYDSINVPGQNGYQLVRDQRGVRWIPLVADGIPGVPGIATEGIFVLNEGVPLYP